MTRNDDFIGLVEAYLDEYEGLTPMPDEIRNAIRAELPITKQIGPRVGLARFSPMNNYWKFGIAAAAVVAATLIGLQFINNQVGPDVSPTPSGSPEAQALPDELKHRFLGAVPEALGRPQAGGAILDMTGDVFFYDAAARIFLSRVSVIGDELRFVSFSPPGITCDAGNVGTYPYSLSPGGSFLTIGEGTDDCAARAIGLPGTWQLSNCRTPDDDCLGNLEAGTYSSFYFEPMPDGGVYQPRFGAFTYTVPDGWAAYGDGPDGYGLTTQAEYEAFDGTECFDCPGTRDLVEVLGDVGAATPDCEETNLDVGGTIDDLVAWMESHPGMVISDRHSTTVGGLPAIAFRISMDPSWTGTCDPENPFNAVPVFYRIGSYHWAMSATDGWYVTLVDLGGGHNAAVVVDAGDTANLDTFNGLAQPIIESMEFTSR